MKKIDTTSWKEFRVGDLFDIHPTKAYKLTNVQLFDGGRTPVVVNSAYNNGIGGYSTLDATEKGNMITFSDTVDANTIFYQKEDFVGYPHVQGMYPTGMFKDKWRPYSLMFFASLFRKTAVSKGFDYGNKFRRDIAIDIKLKLPAKNDAPDWQYMEDYMRQIEVRAKSSISALHDANYSNVSVNTAYWKVFKIGDLFPTINKPKVYHTREVVEDSSGIPYIVRSKFNNGIKCRVKPDGLVCSPKGVITFGAENAAFFYQKEEWCGGRDIYYIDTRNIKHYACMFLVACLNQITEKYTYNFGLFPDLLKQESIKLPATPSGDPDWHYMEMYMRGVEAIVKNKLSLLVPHKSEVAIKDAANVTFNNATVTYIDQSKTYNVK